MTLAQLKAILDSQFRPPFLREGHVVASWRSDGTLLNIQIGRRDVDVDENGHVEAAGTLLTMQEEIEQDIDWLEHAAHGETQERCAHIAKALRRMSSDMAANVQ